MIFALESQIAARLAARLPVGTLIKTTFDEVDLSDEAVAPVVVQLQLDRVGGSGGVSGSAAQVEVAWSVTVYVHTRRATSGELSVAESLLPGAINALVRWPYAVNQYPVITDGPPTVFDGQILRLGFSFVTVLFFSG